MVMPPISTISNLPFSNTRVSSGPSNRFRITSIIIGSPQLGAPPLSPSFGDRVGANTPILNLAQKLAIFLAQLRTIQQIRSIRQRLLQRPASPPPPNFIVVPIQQRFRDRHPAKLRRTRVMRIIQQAARPAG